jgi:hypothetical protein
MRPSRCKTDAVDCLGLNYTPMVPVNRASRDTIPLSYTIYLLIIIIKLIHIIKFTNTVFRNIFILKLAFAEIFSLTNNY